MGIPNLFEYKEKTIQTQEWYSLLSQSPEKYQNCVVKTLTHVKSLRSKVVHEYLQAIIEDLDTGTRTRLIAERQVAQDQVILGRWASKKSFGLLRSSSSSSSGPSSDLPLPLFSVSLDSNNFRVLDLAGILAHTTKIGGKYNLLTKNCYWFALTAYMALKYKFNGREERWYFWKWRGRLIIFKNAALVSFPYSSRSLDDFNPMCAGQGRRVRGRAKQENEVGPWQAHGYLGVPGRGL
jgi:hypothetical protein